MQLTHTLQFFKKRCVLQKADGYTALLSKIALQSFFFFFLLIQWIAINCMELCRSAEKRKERLILHTLIKALSPLHRFGSTAANKKQGP